MKSFLLLGIGAALVGGIAFAADAPNSDTRLVITASNAATNQLLVYSSAGKLLQTLPTQGQGGASGNAGGIAARDGMIAVVNFNSKSVSIIGREGQGFRVREVIPAASNPLSVAFGAAHLYILGTTKIESHRIFGSNVSSNPDGVVTLLHADGTAAQVGVLPGALLITEKSNVIETVDVRADGAVAGTPTLVMNIPSNVNAPFGLVTRGNNAYVTIAHADEIALVRNGTVLTVTPSGTQHAPCWVSLDGPFLFAANTASDTVSRYAVYGQKIVQDAAVAAQLGGGATDIASRDGLLAVIDSSNGVSHISTFSVDEDGNLTLKGAATINAPANGVAIVPAD